MVVCVTGNTSNVVCQREGCCIVPSVLCMLQLTALVCVLVDVQGLVAMTPAWCWAIDFPSGAVSKDHLGSRSARFILQQGSSCHIMAYACLAFVCGMRSGINAAHQRPCTALHHT